MPDRIARLERPPISCEINTQSVIAARRHRNEVSDVHTRKLPAGAVIPSLTGQNIAQAGILRDAISSCIDAVGRGREVVAVVPDAAARIVLLDFESFPTKRDEAEPVVRFRLKKSLPFDPEKASISYTAARGTTGTRVIVAVMLRSVLDEYETVFREAGFEPGVVIPSTVAALGSVDASRPTMLIKVDSGTTSVAVVDQEQLLLYRTLETGDAAITPERLADDVYPSLVYFQDTYGVSIERILLAGVAEASQVRSALSQQTSASIEEISRSFADTNAQSDAAGAVGALF
jgi:type IV pilus assembly protein PilM